MKYLLDTNICIYLIKRKPALVMKRFEQHKPGDIGISTVTLSELTYGVAKSCRINNNQFALEQCLVSLEIATYDAAAAAAYGPIRATLERQGQPIGGMDVMIAAHAVSLNVVLVTNSVKEFDRVDGLRIENWAE